MRIERTSKITEAKTFLNVNYTNKANDTKKIILGVLKYK